MASMNARKLEKPPPVQHFQYLLVLDFEATCWKYPEKGHYHEIIEFPAVLYNINTDTVVEEFQEYVRPTEIPTLSQFCLELTGIKQCQVDSAQPFSNCFTRFMSWLELQKTLYSLGFPGEKSKKGINKCAFVTWSDWDLGTCFKDECFRKGVSYPNIFRKWINLRKVFSRNVARSFQGLNGALSVMGLTFEGTEHCGLHDARNTARLAGQMFKNGVPLHLTTN